VALVYGILQALHIVFGLLYALLIVCAIRGLSLHAAALWPRFREVSVSAAPEAERAQICAD